MALLSTPIGDHLELRLLEPRHATAVFAVVAANRNHLRPWMPWLDATQSEQDVRAFVESSLRGFAEGRTLDRVARVGRQDQPRRTIAPDGRAPSHASRGTIRIPAAGQASTHNPQP